MWSEGNGLYIIWDFKYIIENLRYFVDLYYQKFVNVIIEYVWDGSVVRVLFFLDYYLVIVMLLGIKCLIF